MGAPSRLTNHTVAALPRVSWHDLSLCVNQRQARGQLSADSLDAACPAVGSPSSPPMQVLTIQSVIMGLQFLMLEPNPDDPLNKEVRALFPKTPINNVTPQHVAERRSSSQAA